MSTLTKKHEISLIADLFKQFVVCGSFVLKDKGLLEREANDIDIIVPTYYGEIVTTLDYGIMKVNVHEPINLKLSKVDIMSVGIDGYRLIQYEYNKFWNCNFQTVEQIVWAMQYALDNDLTNSPDKRRADLLTIETNSLGLLEFRDENKLYKNWLKSMDVIYNRNDNKSS